MTRKTSKILSEEHKNILKVIDALNAECNELENGAEIDKEFFIKAIDFIRNYADKFHHAKEEDILFKELCKPEAKMHCNPTEQMLYEHDLGRGFVKEMEKAVLEGDKEKLIENSRSYAQLLREHIYKEDNILYPMADESLSYKTEKSMIARFDKVEKSKAADKKKYTKFAGGLK
ncbi:hemerythrin domain-containing protein [Candidatus Pacearchaeota archaeon]|nr:hemerythrin domain-containing protein [Candidatus Pacearchaeota archaeon]